MNEGNQEPTHSRLIDKMNLMPEAVMIMVDLGLSLNVLSYLPA